MPHKLLKEKAEERYSFHAIKLINWHNFANNSNQQPTLTDRPMAPPFVVGQMKSPKVGGMYTPVKPHMLWTCTCTWSSKAIFIFAQQINK